MIFMFVSQNMFYICWRFNNFKILCQNQKLYNSLIKMCVNIINKVGDPTFILFYNKNVFKSNYCSQ